jgi:hypothetical protein
LQQFVQTFLQMLVAGWISLACFGTWSSQCSKETHQSGHTLQQLQHVGKAFLFWTALIPLNQVLLPPTLKLQLCGQSIWSLESPLTIF